MSKTSTDAKRRYNKKTYSKITFSVKKELANEFREKCKFNGDAQASVLKIAIEKYIAK